MYTQETKYEPSHTIRQSNLFAIDNDKVIEVHSIFTVVQDNGHETDSFEEQLNRLKAAYSSWCTEKKSTNSTLFIRFFVSDIANQASFIQSKDFANCAISIVQQPPLAYHTKVSMWCYDIIGQNVVSDGVFHSFQNNGYTHYWTANRSLAEGDSAFQTHRLLETYEEDLTKAGIQFADNCIRTWFFVQNVDVNYQGVVKGRKENFETIGLTQNTHYIASTGIEGRTVQPSSYVLLDAYAVKGLQKGQQQYLYAKEYLNATYEYGVTFERGVKVMYGDRDHLYISGTASINNKGEVMHVGDIKKQTFRMLENVEALLHEGEAEVSDIAICIIYLRHMADYQTVKKIIDESAFKTCAKTFVLAPVCRPTWLIEMECIAIRANKNEKYKNF